MKSDRDTPRFGCHHQDKDQDFPKSYKSSDVRNSFETLKDLDAITKTKIKIFLHLVKFEYTKSV